MATFARCLSTETLEKRIFGFQGLLGKIHLAKTNSATTQPGGGSLFSGILQWGKKKDDI